MSLGFKIQNNTTSTNGGPWTTLTTSQLNVANSAVVADLFVAGDAKVGEDSSQGIILTNPNGIEYRVTVDAGGLVVATPVV